MSSSKPNEPARDASERKRPLSKGFFSSARSFLAERLNPQVDYVGQELSRKVMNAVFIIGYPVALLLGILMGDIFVTLYASAAVIAVGALLTVPGWPIFRRNPVAFYGSKRMKDE